jgi:Ni/Fe-hydrogenase subunit HybB-like protein
MSQRDLHARLVARSVSGRYDLFLGVGAGLSILGAILLLFRVGGGDHARTWHMVQVNWLFFTGLSTGSVAFAASQKITNAKWSGVIIRFAEAAAAFLPISLLTLILIFTAGYDAIYGRMAEQLPSLQPGKALWLSHGFMFARLFIALAFMSALGWRLIRADLVPDLLAVRASAPANRRGLYDRMTREFDGSDAARFAHQDRIARLAPGFAVTYSIVMTLIAFDCVMALQPHWFSNLLGAFFFMGAFLGAHMLLALMMIYGASHLGVTDLVSPKQRHDLGKLCFGFTVFWTYLMWAQFLVIWYGNLPEETGFVFTRLWGHWLPIGKLVLIGMFIVPFFGLLGVAPKKNRVTMGFFATVSLVGLWLERYLLVMPSITTLPGPAIGLPEIGSTMLFAGLYLLTYALFARTFPMISPRLAEITLDRERGHTSAHVAAEFDHEESARDYVSLDSVERRGKPR